MLFCFWSAKGGSGTSVVAAATALVLARGVSGVVLVDLDGDQPAVLGIPEPEGPGVGEWLAAGDEVEADALGRLEVEVHPGLRLLPRGAAPPAGDERAEVLAAALAADGRPVVVDAGTAPTGPALAVAAGASHSLLVTRPCYLALRRALGAPLQPSGVVLLAEAHRALARADVEEVLGVGIWAELPVDPSVARAVDAGLLAGRLPRGLARALRHAA